MKFKSVGVTGSRNGMSALQRKTVKTFLEENQANVLHHGDCVGVDCEVAHLFADYDSYIIAHPGSTRGYRANCTANDLILPWSDNLIRNRHIVNSVEFLLALPGTDFEIQHSGTWHTVRYARKQEINYQVITPNGQVIK